MNKNFSERLRKCFKNFAGSKYPNPQVMSGNRWAHYIEDWERTDTDNWDEFKDCDLIIDGTDESMINDWLYKNNMTYKVTQVNKVPYDRGISIGFKFK